MSMSLLQLASALMSSSLTLHHHLHRGMEKACVMLRDEAKSAIGTYKYGWPSLAPSTLARKSGDTPLLETGQLQGSIEYNLDGPGNRIEAYVGTDDRKAAWQEFGTSRGIPPRPFIGGAANAKGAEAARLVATEAKLALSRR